MPSDRDPKEPKDAKAVTIRVPRELWNKCAHKMLDAEESWQSVLIGALERYSKESDSSKPNDPAPAKQGSGRNAHN